MSILEGVKLAGLMGASAVAFGAFGAHGLKSRGVAPEMLKAWETAAHYHLIHSVAMLLVTKSTTQKLFCVGTLLFSGSIYAMVLTGYKKLGIITPIGGTTLIVGWLSLVF